MNSLYDSADIYDMFQTEQKYGIAKKHWQKLFEGKKIKTMLDISIGTGNLTLPASELGVKLYGSDLSPNMLLKCKEKANAKEIDISLTECDFRELSKAFSQKFDIVCSTGNSLPYVTNTELLSVIEQMDKLVSYGGYIYFDLRNWDKILADKQRFYIYDPSFHDDIRINAIQLWDYNEDGSITFNIIYAYEKTGHIFNKQIFTENYHPISKAVLLNKLHILGYTDICTYPLPAHYECPSVDEVYWYCVMAKKQ